MIMNRIKILLLTLALMFGITEINAQSFQLKDLIGKTWVGVSGYNGCEYLDWAITFTEKSSIHRGTDKEGKEIATFCYNTYLCNELPIRYEETLLGKSRNGKYIVFERTYNYKGRQIEDFKIFEIKSLTSDSLVVKSNGLTITFEAK